MPYIKKRQIGNLPYIKKEANWKFALHKKKEANWEFALHEATGPHGD